MEVQTIRDPDGTTREYLVAPMPDGARYRPGYVNNVWWREVDAGWFRAYYTDGYKTQLLGDFQGRADTVAAAEHAIAFGAGGGFTSWFAPNGGADD